MSSIFFYEPFYEFDRLADQVFNTHPSTQAANNRQLERQGPGDGAIRSHKPRMDLHENSDKNLVTATFELPGVKKENVQMNSQNGLLTVAVETKLSTEHAESGYAVRERRLGKFSRSLRLPEGTKVNMSKILIVLVGWGANGDKPEDIKAAMQDGLLTVTFPKSSPAQAQRKITIN